MHISIIGLTFVLTLSDAIPLIFFGGCLLFWLVGNFLGAIETRFREWSHNRMVRKIENKLKNKGILK